MSETPTFAPSDQALASAESYRQAAQDAGQEQAAILSKRAELTEKFAAGQDAAAAAGEQVPAFNSTVRDEIRDTAPVAVRVDDLKARTEAAQAAYRLAQQEVGEAYQDAA